MLAAGVWALVFLIIGGLSLTGIYRQSVLRQLDRELAVTIDGLAGGLISRGEGPPSLANAPNDPRYLATFAGRYWQISADGKPVLRSPSLWDEALRWPAPAGDPAAALGAVTFADAAGPSGQRLRIAAFAVLVPQREAPLVFFAAADRADAEADLARFSLTLFSALAALALGLIVAVVAQVRVGLAPLKALEADVAAVRRGAAERLNSGYPSEVAPLAEEVNKLLDHNRAVVERARTHVGNLAHALKTPISVLLNEARAADEAPLAALVRRQAEAMAGNVDHYLRRAQAAARAETLGARTPIAAVLEDLARTLERVHGRDKDLDLDVAIAPDAGLLAFRGERQDFEEMVGNLMDNACKYGRGVVRVDVERDVRERVRIRVRDDGPGLPPDRLHEALRRGARLDERAPGQGLGLSIVDELARAYGGELSLSRADLGGLEASLSLPALE